MNDKVIEKTELVIKALDYAHAHNLDISNRQDVIEILDAIDPQHIHEEEIQEFMKLIEDADTFMNITALRKGREKTNLPN